MSSSAHSSPRETAGQLPMDALLSGTTAQIQKAPQTSRHSVWLSNKLLEGLSAGFGIVGAIVLAVNVSFSPTGWVFMFVSSLFAVPWAIREKLHYMLVMQTIFLIINLIGIWRHLVPMLAR